MLNAYAHRIRQAQQGETHPGPLPGEYMETLLDIYKQREEAGDTQGPGDWYIIDRLREQSRILEPDQNIKPYRYLEKVQAGSEQALQCLPDILDREEAANLVRQWLRQVPPGDRGPRERANILIGGLNQAPRIGEAFARELLPQVPEALDLLPLPRQADEVERQATLLEKSLFVAAHFDRKDAVPDLVDRFERLLESQREAPTVQALDAVAAQCFRGLRKLGLPDDIRRLLNLLAEVMLRGQELRIVAEPGVARTATGGTTGLAPRRRRLVLLWGPGPGGPGGGGRTSRPADAARPRKSPSPGAGGQELIERLKLARAYASALGQAPVELAQARFEELFEKLDGIRDPWTTSRYYLLSQLQIVEAVVLAAVSDDFTLGPALRRRLDDDEVQVRRRIHRDVRRLCPSGSLV